MTKFQWLRTILYILLGASVAYFVLAFVGISTIKVRPTKQFAEMYVDEGDILDFNALLCPHEKYKALLQIDSNMREKVAEYMKENDYKLKNGHQEFVRSNPSFEELIGSGFAFEKITNEDKKTLNSIHAIDVSNLQEREYEEKFYDDIASECYSEKNIKIVYPQFLKDSFGTNTSHINELIKHEATHVLDIYKNDEDNVSIDVSYVITYRNDKILSVIFLGTANISIIEHADDLFWTLNINLQNGEKLNLNDVIDSTQEIADIIKDKNFIFKVYNGEKSAFFCYVNDYLHKDGLGQCDVMGSKMYSYFTEESIGISFCVPYSLGGHKEIEIAKDMGTVLLSRRS